MALRQRLQELEQRLEAEPVPKLGDDLVEVVFGHLSDDPFGLTRK
jgi:hypothetical protein